MVTHSKDVIGLADRILTIRNGKVTEIKKEDAFA
jgi:ABC-type lipoprotein export system ATPase subunit